MPKHSSEPQKIREVRVEVLAELGRELRRLQSLTGLNSSIKVE